MSLSQELSDDQKSEYNHLVINAKENINKNKLQDAISCYERAFAIFPSEKLEGRIKKLSGIVGAGDNSNALVQPDKKRPYPMTPEHNHGKRSPEMSQCDDEPDKPVVHTEDLDLSTRFQEMSLVDLMSEARKCVANNDVQTALKMYRHAFTVQPTEKLQRRIDRMKMYLTDNKENSKPLCQDEGKCTPLHKPKTEKSETNPTPVKQESQEELKFKQETEISVDYHSSPQSTSSSTSSVKKEEQPSPYFKMPNVPTQPSTPKAESTHKNLAFTPVTATPARHHPELTNDEIATYNSLITSGKEMIRQGHFADAVSLYESAYDINKSDKLLAKLNKIKAQVDMDVDCNTREPDIDLDIENHYTDLLSRAKIFVEEEKLKDALETFNDAFAIKPNDKLSRKIQRLKDYMQQTQQPVEEQASNEPEESGSEETEKYNALILEAKDFIRSSEVPQALEKYQQAYDLIPSDKLLKKINKCKEWLSAQEGDDDSGENNMAHVGNGFYLYKDLFGNLYPHQRESLLWFWGLHNKKRGGILADDMGLGKTIQVISFLCGLFDAEEIKTVMIVMPLSLIENWKREFDKWAPGILVLVYHGVNAREKAKTAARIQRRGGVMLTSYGMIVSSADLLSKKDGEKFGRDFVWDYVILDEGHKIKNPTKTSQGVHRIGAKHRIILTGTPVQNNLKEMWALFDWTHHGLLLGTRKTFQAEYEKPITRAREKCATYGERRLGEHMAGSLKKIISPYFLRRTKQEVAKAKAEAEAKGITGTRRGPEMPTLTRKNDFVCWVYLNEQQQKIYRDFSEQDEIKQLLNTSKSPLTALVILKKICDHPRLLSLNACQKLGLFTPNELRNADDEFTMKECAANQIHSVDDEILINESGKLTFLVQLMARLKEEKHRTLIFSASRKMLDIIQKVLTNRGHTIMRLDGTITDLNERERCVTTFQQSDIYDTFLLTTQVGGVGLTLTAADRVVIFDPSWNPATDSQAVDRAFRIGQQKNVAIYRLISCGSIEEKIYRRQVFKDSVTRQTIQGDNTNLMRYFSKTELRELFTLDNPTTSATQQQLEHMHSHQRVTDTDLDEHIAYLYSCAMFGLSDHDLMFSQEDEDHTAGAADDITHITQRVNNAAQMLTREAELQGEVNEEQGRYIPEFLQERPKVPRVTHPSGYPDNIYAVDEAGVSSHRPNLHYSDFIDLSEDTPQAPLPNNKLFPNNRQPVKTAMDNWQNHLQGPESKTSTPQHSAYNTPTGSKANTPRLSGSGSIHNSYGTASYRSATESPSSNLLSRLQKSPTQSPYPQKSPTQSPYPQKSPAQSPYIQKSPAKSPYLLNSSAPSPHVLKSAIQSPDAPKSPYQPNHSPESQPMELTHSSAREPEDMMVLDEWVSDDVEEPVADFAQASDENAASEVENASVRSESRGSELWRGEASSSKVYGDLEDSDDDLEESRYINGTGSSLSSNQKSSFNNASRHHGTFDLDNVEDEVVVLADDSSDDSSDTTEDPRTGESILGDSFGNLHGDYVINDSGEGSFHTAAPRRRSVFLQPPNIQESDDEDA